MKFESRLLGLFVFPALLPHVVLFVCLFYCSINIALVIMLIILHFCFRDLTISKTFGLKCREKSPNISHLPDEVLKVII